MSFNFKNEIKDIIISCDNYIEIFSDNKKCEGYALFKKLTKNLEQYYEICEPEDIGQIKKSTYSVWFVSNENINNINYLIYKKTKFNKLYEKYNEETGCYELIVVKKEQQ